MKSRTDQLLIFLSETPDDPFLLFSLAREYQSEGRTEQSLEVYERLIKTDPTYTGLYYHLGKLHEANGEYAKALEVYSAGIEIARKEGDLHAAMELKGALDLLSHNE